MLEEYLLEVKREIERPQIWIFKTLLKFLSLESQSILKVQIQHRDSLGAAAWLLHDGVEDYDVALAWVGLELGVSRSDADFFHGLVLEEEAMGGRSLAS